MESKCKFKRVRYPTEAEDFSSNLCVQTGSGAHPVGTGGSFPGGKARPGRDADHSPPYRAEGQERAGAEPRVTQRRLFGA
jgi:hypothetical protein